jgi:ATP-dependent exoDNAse (exonuclease V) alpha subunit
MEAELGEALAESGQRVVALAQSHTAVQELRDEAGFAGADTLARFFKDEGMQASTRHGLILVDEAGLIGTRDMLRLFDIAGRQDARVVLVGDRKQNRAVAAGEPLKLLEQRAGLPLSTVTEIVRQQGDYKKAAHRPARAADRPREMIHAR